MNYAHIETTGKVNELTQRWEFDSVQWVGDSPYARVTRKFIDDKIGDYRDIEQVFQIGELRLQIIESDPLYLTVVRDKTGHRWWLWKYRMANRLEWVKVRILETARIWGLLE